MRSSKKSLRLALHRSPDEPVRGLGSVHVWLFDLDAGGQAPARSLLSADETHRAERMKGRVQSRRMLSRFSLSRQVLANLTGVDPEDVAYAYGVCGKPRISSASGRGVGFNISHSENVMVMAVGFGLDVGVDVEVVDLAKGSPAFYRAWTLQEAVSKLLGDGFARDEMRAPRRDFVSRTLRAVVARRQIIVTVAAAEPRDSPDPYQGVLSEEPPLLGVPAVDGAGKREVGQE